MSDALLTEISKKLSDIHATLKTAATTPAAGATAPKPGAATPSAADKAKAEAAAKATAAAAAKAAAAPKPATKPAAAGPASGTKAAGGKYTIDQVREQIRAVATNASLGKQSAKDILDQDGGGVTKVVDLKPENYDKVYEACQVALQSEGAPAAPAPAEEDDFS